MSPSATQIEIVIYCFDYVGKFLYFNHIKKQSYKSKHFLLKCNVNLRRVENLQSLCFVHSQLRGDKKCRQGGHSPIKH